MKRLFASAVGLVFTAVLALGPVQAQERSITLLPGTDLPNYDYSVLKDVEPEACEAACADDRICRAFTYNESANWCFLKSEVGTETPFDGATSGRVDFTPSIEEFTAQRLGELPFPAQDLLDS